MLFVISPAKSLDYATPAPADLPTTLPRHLSDSAALVRLLKPMPAAALAELMHVSDALATLNKDRFKTWRKPKEAAISTVSKQAMWAFDGDVYDGLQANSLAPSSWDWAQTHVRMLSGLYGTLRPFDVMQPYRLEMGTALANARGANLYAFWGERIAKQLKADMADHGTKAVVNLASIEYFKAVAAKALKAPVVDCVFEDLHMGDYKVLGFFAKRARGCMLRFAIENRVSDVAQLRGFAENGYAFAADASTDSRLVFRRDQNLDI